MSEILAQKPKRSRKWMLRITLIVVIVIFAVVIFLTYMKSQGIANYLSHMPEAPNAVTVETVKLQSWTPQIDSTGSIRPNQGAMLSSQSSGTVKQIVVQAGQKVKKGDLLIELDSDVEKANLAAVKASLTSAQLNYNRMSKLIRSKSVSQSQLDDARATYLAAQGNVKALQATVERRQIYAPFDGVAGIVKVNVGQYVTIGTQMVRVEDRSKSKVDFSVGQNSIDNLKVGGKVLLTVDALNGKTFSGKIVAVDPAVNTNSGLIDVQAVIDDPNAELLSGMFAKVAVMLPQETDQIVIPKVAVAYNMYGENLYVLSPLSDEDKEKFADNKNLDKLYRAHLVTVHTIDRSSIYAHLKTEKDSVKAGDMIVTGGQQRLSNGSLVQVSDKPGVGTSEPAVKTNL